MITSGQYHNSWRNRLHWSVEGLPPERLDALTKRVQLYFPGVKMNLPRRARTQGNLIELTFEENGFTQDIALSGSGLREIVALAAMVELSSAKLVLLDEPDSHLHPRLQREVGRFLAERADADKQIIISTHSAELIEEVPLASLLWSH
jgi:predicted ATPase